MSARIINGKAFAERLSGRIVSAISTFQSETGRVPGLAVVLVGNDPASEVHVRSKDRKALELGMESFQHIHADAQHPDRGAFSGGPSGTSTLVTSITAHSICDLSQRRFPSGESRDYAGT